eukprot:scaffold3311_cov411-Prasinococcus_capsulatus_cf.AAC.12
MEATNCSFKGPSIQVCGRVCAILRTGGGPGWPGTPSERCAITCARAARYGIMVYQLRLETGGRHFTGAVPAALTTKRRQADDK